VSLTIYPEASGSGLPTTDLLRSYLASTVTYNNTATLANTALSVTVATGGTYDIELVVHAGDTTASRLKLDFGGTATFTNFIGQWQASITDEYITGYSDRSTDAGADFNGSGSLEGVPSYWTFKGTAEIDAGGTFLLRGAQNAAVSENTTILRGS